MYGRVTWGRAWSRSALALRPRSLFEELLERGAQHVWGGNVSLAGNRPANRPRDRTGDRVCSNSEEVRPQALHCGIALAARRHQCRLADAPQTLYWRRAVAKNRRVVSERRRELNQWLPVRRAPRRFDVRFRRAGESHERLQGYSRCIGR